MIKSAVSPGNGINADFEEVMTDTNYLDTVEVRDSSSLGPTTLPKQTNDLPAEAAPANKAAVSARKGETEAPVSPSKSRQGLVYALPVAKGTN